VKIHGLTSPHDIITTINFTIFLNIYFNKLLSKLQEQNEQKIKRYEIFVIVLNHLI